MEKEVLDREEVYALDNSPEQAQPYRVSERSYTLRRLQPRGANTASVFLVHPRETIDFHFERKLYDLGGVQRADPRVGHAVTLAVNDYGQVLQSVAIGYGRRRDEPDPILTAADRAAQRRL